MHAEVGAPDKDWDVCREMIDGLVPLLDDGDGETDVSDE